MLKWNLLLKQESAAVHASAAADELASQTMVDMGFHVSDITTALEQTQFDFGSALVRLLNGLDEQRTMFDTKQQKRFRLQSRQATQVVREENLIGKEVFTQYTQRTSQSFGLDVVVWDLDQYAGDTSGACFG